MNFFNATSDSILEEIRKQIAALDKVSPSPLIPKAIYIHRFYFNKLVKGLEEQGINLINFTPNSYVKCNFMLNGCKGYIVDELSHPSIIVYLILHESRNLKNTGA